MPSCRTSRKRRSNEELNQPDPNRTLKPTPCVLTRATAEALAVSGKGVTLTPAERRQVQKATVYPFIQDTRAVRVAPRVSEADRQRYEAMTKRVAA